MHERECTGANTPDTATSDYETFVVDKSECILGQKTTYVRRKATSQVTGYGARAADGANNAACSVLQSRYASGRQAHVGDLQVHRARF
jgi:hypothetical protein